MRKLIKFMLTCLILTLSATTHATGTTAPAQAADSSVQAGEVLVPSWPPIGWPPSGWPED